jgi:nucleoside-diphosphate-sugar epimerase
MKPAERAKRRRVLVTGAAGKIGQDFVRSARNRYRLRIADRAPLASVNMHAVNSSEGGGTIQLDIADLAACQRACAQIDTVVHLAADANPAAEFYDSLLENNIKGTYNIFRAARDQGCRRVIFASSAWVMGG